MPSSGNGTCTARSFARRVRAPAIVDQGESRLGPVSFIERDRMATLQAGKCYKDFLSNVIALASLLSGFFRFCGGKRLP